MNIVLYARYSSDNQRTESIDAQLRAMKKYAELNQMNVIDTYIDEERSATSDDRESFQRMMSDAKDNKFTGVLVHKLDRFARNRYDSAFYKRHLRNNGIRVYSVLENLDDSPESVILESILEGMAEYYSRNLSREVMKGLSETAYQCKHTGGVPPLGFDVGPDRTYIINEFEAQAVRTMFTMYAHGHGYTDIINALNAAGHKTKLGRPFGKNSIHDILKNEKYTGTFIFNKSRRSINGKRNHHAHKPDEEVIRIPGGCPEIVSKEYFDLVQEKMKKNRHEAGRYTSKLLYVLSGKVICGKCGAAMTGKRAKMGRNKIEYAYYECSARKNKKTCDAKPINKEFLENTVIDMLYETLFSSKAIDQAADKISEGLSRDRKETPEAIKRYASELTGVEVRIANIIKAIEEGMYQPSMKAQMDGLEDKKRALTDRIREAEKSMQLNTYTRDEVYAFLNVYRDIKAMDDKQKRAAVDVFVEQVVVHEENVQIFLPTRLTLINIDSKNKHIAGVDGAGCTLSGGDEHKPLAVQLRKACNDSLFIDVPIKSYRHVNKL